jgi:Cof subfamily protein (haloacid dehalogenase superfamily)
MMIVLILTFQTVIIKCTTSALSLEKIAVANAPANEIRCILCDIDGTLTYGEHHEISDHSIHSIRSAIGAGFLFFPATGRSRYSMNLVTEGAIAEIFGGVKQTPGVYQQGLMVYGPDGNLIYERTLIPEIIEKVTSFCEVHGVSVVAYAGDDIYRKQPCTATDSILAIEKLVPKNCPQGLDKLHEVGVKVHKMILLSNDDILKELRPALQSALEGIATLTQAVPGMLEVLPFGCSKGLGVMKLLEHVGISPEQAVAFGDGENDVEMFQAVKFGIAVGNAKPLLKQAARFVTDSNAELGVANALQKIIEARRRMSRG